MPAKINLIGQQFGNLTVLEETAQRKNNSVVWQCKCSCGNIEYYSTKELRSDEIKACYNCHVVRQPQTHLKTNIIGQKFNHLMVLEATPQRQSGAILYKCECDCNEHNIVYVTRTDLQSNHTKSCGCIARKYSVDDVVNNRKILKLIGQKQGTKNYYFQCQCLLCGRTYEATTTTLDKTLSCGCQKSIGEFNIIRLLEQNQIDYQKEYCFPNSSYRFDFALLNNNIVYRLIEFDGEQHYKEGVRNQGWNTQQKYEKTVQHDQIKNHIAYEHKIPLVRIPYWERNSITIDKVLSDQYLVKEQIE